MIARIVICILLAGVLIALIIKKNQEDEKRIDIKIGDTPIFEMEMKESPESLFKTGDVDLQPREIEDLKRIEQQTITFPENALDKVTLEDTPFYLHHNPTIGRKTTKSDPKLYEAYKQRLKDRKAEALVARREYNSRRPPAVYPLWHHYNPRFVSAIEAGWVRQPPIPMRPIIFLR